jgi:activator of HSP90 ATPase
MSHRIHQEILFAASPQRVYRALTDSKQFSALSGAPADISSDEGGAFSCFGGMITGRNVELLPGERVVQAWRAGTWEPGAYSIARFSLEHQSAGTLLVFDHAGFPKGQGEHLEAGWRANYWEPMKNYLQTQGDA